MAEQNLRIRLEDELKISLDRVLQRQGISQQAAIVRLIELFVASDPMLQALMLGQVPEGYRGQIAQIMLNQMAGTHEIHLSKAARDFGDGEEQTGTKD